MQEATAPQNAPAYTFSTRSFAIANWLFVLALGLLVQWLPQEVKRTAGFVGTVHLLFDALCIAWLVPDARPRGIKLGLYIACLIPFPEFTMAAYIYKTRGGKGLGEWLGKALLLIVSAALAAGLLMFAARQLQ